MTFLTLCRNLQSTGRVSLPSFCSTMWVRLSRDTFSLQLHTAELWIREFWGSEAKKKRGSPNMSFMIGLAEMRESARMNVFTSFSCLSKCCGGEDVFYADLLRRIICFPFRINALSKTHFYLQLRCDDGVAHFHLPSVSSLFGGEHVVIRNRP